MPRADDTEVLEQGIEPDVCHVVDVGCEAPAGWIHGDQITEGEEVAEFICDECWEPVCGSCSRALADGRRVCVGCAEGERLADEERPELPPAAVGGLKVFSKMCGTCVFGPKSPVRPGRLRDLERQWQSKDTHQTCHLAGVGTGSDDDDDRETLDGEDIVCHGFFREVFLRHGTGQNLRISGRLGGFEYIDPDEYKKAKARR